MSEFALHQINAKCDTIIALLRAHREQAQEITKLRLAIYRAVDHNTDRLDRKFLQGIIAEFEPNYPDGG